MVAGAAGGGGGVAYGAIVALMYSHSVPLLITTYVDVATVIMISPLLSVGWPSTAVNSAWVGGLVVVVICAIWKRPLAMLFRMVLFVVMCSYVAGVSNVTVMDLMPCAAIVGVYVILIWSAVNCCFRRVVSVCMPVVVETAVTHVSA